MYFGVFRLSRSRVLDFKVRELQPEIYRLRRGYETQEHGSPSSGCTLNYHGLAFFAGSDCKPEHRVCVDPAED